MYSELVRVCPSVTVSVSVSTVGIGAWLLAACAVQRTQHGDETGKGAPIAACATRSGADADRDGLGDACELALARVFAPELVADADDCLWDAGARRLDGGYLFAVAPQAAGGARIAYLPAYARDCGWRGGGSAHDGDSELVVVDVADVAGSARVDGIFLSAHCFGRSDGRCRWFRAGALGRFAWRDGGAPVVWVALAKHAHYPTRAACESGHWRRERCASRDRERRFRFPVAYAAQNVGSRDRPAHAARGCLAGSALPLAIRGANPAARECLWADDAPFRGWRGETRGAPPTSYGLLLGRIAGW